MRRMSAISPAVSEDQDRRRLPFAYGFLLALEVSVLFWALLLWFVL